MTIARIIDVETTGIEPTEAKVIELAFVDLDLEARHIVETFQSFVAPGIAIPPEASAVHHILDEDVQDAPALEALYGRLAGADYYIAHNSRYECAFLPQVQPWGCTYRAAVRIWPEAPSHSLQVLRYWRGLNDIPGLDRHTAPMHRALPDALVTAALLVDILRFCSIDEMVEWAGGPALLPRFTFGKHAMIPIQEVPHSYLDWVLGQDFDEDVIFTTKHELRRRAEATMTPLQRFRHICESADTQEQVDKARAELRDGINAGPPNWRRKAKDIYDTTIYRLRSGGATA